MTRAQMKKIYVKVFLGILAFAAFVGVIFIQGEIQRRLDTSDQYLIKAAEPRQLLKIKANVSTLTDGGSTLREVTSMQPIEKGYTYYIGCLRQFSKSASGMPYGTTRSETPLLLLEGEKDTHIKVTGYGVGISGGRLLADGSFEATDVLASNVSNELALEIGIRISYSSDNEWPDPSKVAHIPDVPAENREYERYYNEPLTDMIAGLPLAMRRAYRIVKEGTVIATCYDNNDSKRIIAEAEFRVRLFEEFRLDGAGRKREYEDALRRSLTPTMFQNVDLQKYYPYTEIELVRYEQIEVWD